MAWDFPPASEGAVYTPAGGPTYTYTGGIWRVLPTPQTALSSKSISDTPPLNPIHGQSWWNSTDGFSYIYYVDPGGAPGQWVQESDTSLPDAPSDGGFYVRSGGVWVQVPRFTKYRPGGYGFLEIPVPLGASACRINGMLWLPSAAQTLLQISVTPGVYVTAAASYATQGGYHYTVTNNTTWIPVNASTYAGLLVSNTHDSTSAPVRFECHVNVNRDVVTSTFGMDVRSSSYNSANGIAHLFTDSVLLAAQSGGALQVVSLKLLPSAAVVWGNNSFVNVEWF